MTVNTDPHNTEEDIPSPIPQLFIINPTTGTQQPFNGSVKDLLAQHPKYNNARTVLHAGPFGIYMCFYEPGSKEPDD
jgi:hypothetical protein